MEIFIEDKGNVRVVKLIGELDGNTAPAVQEEVLPLISPGAKILLDMTALDYMSSAGARTMLLIHRQISQNEADVILAGLNADITDMLSITGFLDYFELAETVEAGLAELGE